MKQTIKKILKEEQGLEQKFLNSIQKLQWILESNVNPKIISEVEIVNGSYHSRYNEPSGIIKVKSYEDNPDIGAFKSQLSRVDEELQRVVGEYSFTREGSLIKSSFENIMCMPVNINWGSDNNYNLNVEYYFSQDEYES
jgi:hypothetical protein